MRRVHVDSSAVASAGYDPAARTLEIKFTNGKTYRYLHVPRSTYDDFMRSESKGVYVNAVIKKLFRHEPL